jgi:hypothetical protein
LGSLDSQTLYLGLGAGNVCAKNCQAISGFGALRFA